MQLPDSLKYRYPLFLFLALILGVSSIPGQSLPQMIALSPDKFLHILEYMVVGWLTVRWITYDFVQWTKKKVIFTTLIGGLAFAAIDEAYQGLIPGRYLDVYDWIADGIGIGIVLFIYHFTQTKYFWIHEPK